MVRRNFDESAIAPANAPASQMEPDLPGNLHFAGWTLNLARLSLEGDGREIFLRPKSFEVLRYLAANPGRVITKDELIARVWSGTFVTDDSLVQCIKDIREAICDQDRRIIKTLPRRGYLFAAVVRDGAASPISADSVSPVRFAKSGEIHIAYRVWGEGPRHLVFCPGFVTHIENAWTEPSMARFLRRMGQFARVIMFDKRGTGMSDRVNKVPGLDERVDDLRAILDAVNVERAAILGPSEGGSLAAYFAATQPHRCEALVLYGAFARFASWIRSEEALQGLLQYIDTSWGSGASLPMFAPSMVGNAAFQAWWGRYERLGATPAAAMALMRLNSQIDITDVLPRIRVPTLIIHRTADACVNVEGGRQLAASIPNARLIELPGGDHLPWVGGNADEILWHIERFLAGPEPVQEQMTAPASSDLARQTPTVRLAPPDRSSIAVLPFINMSTDRDQEFFADGVTEDITTALSRIRQFFVIARNATLRYRSSRLDVREIAATLGVRYIVEGSVRKAAARVRISAQLIDGTTGNHIWAERFDRELDDIFKIQDDIARGIAGQIEPELGRAEYERTRTAPPENLGAWELFHRGMALIAKRTREGNAEARHLLERSLSFDPNFAPAHAAIAWSQAEDRFFRYAEHETGDILGRARRAVALDERDALSHLALAWALTFNRQPTLAIDAARRSIELNPSFAHAHAILGRILIQSGLCQEGIEEAELAIRLSPRAPNARQYLNVAAIGHFYLGRDTKAVELARKAIQSFDTWVPHMILTAALGHLGDPAGAGQERLETEKHRPDFSIEQVRRDYLVFDERCLDRLLTGLRKAGVRESCRG